MKLFESHTPCASELSVMTISGRIKLLISAPSLPKNVAARERDSVRAIVGLHSHGNIFLQWGHFYTKRDIDGKFESVSKIKFSNTVNQ